MTVVVMAVAALLLGFGGSSTTTVAFLNQHQHQYKYQQLLHHPALNSQSNDNSNSNNSNNDQYDKLQSGYDTIDGYERFLYSKKQRKKNEQKDISFRRKIIANNNVVNGPNINNDAGDVAAGAAGTAYSTNSGNRDDDDDDDDGYTKMMQTNKRRPLYKKVLMAPFQVGMKIGKTIMRDVPEPGTLILVRHGESEWNANKTFTGWADPGLSEQGIRETEHAARLLLAGGYDIDVVFTSRLKRAIRSTWIILGEMNQLYLPVFKSWRLNERMYGALTGLCKKDTAERVGMELVQTWRGSLKSRPPPVTVRDTYWPGRDRRYSDLQFEQIPLTESLLDCMSRTEPIWEDKIKWELRRGRNVMAVSHANTLRGLVKLIDGIGDEEIQDIALPTGIPIVYKFDKMMNPVNPKGDKYLSQKHMSGVFLEKPGILNAALKKEKEWCANVPGYNTTMTRSNNGLTSLERSLTKLNAEKELREWAAQTIDLNDLEEDDGSDGNGGKPIMFEEVVEKEIQKLKNEEEQQRVETSKEKAVKPLLITNNNPCMQAFPSQSVIPGFGDVPLRRDPVVVLIRHGKTEHNKLGLFTGWEDAPLANEGRDEARRAGQLLKAHGFEFDVVYTSWLSRAIETAWLVMEEMDCTWLPIIKTWRLNERMYGALTGKSKNMVE
jgi:2,3-bisphosphoglycerate-dependent phosphoglycerate mutase